MKRFLTIAAAGLALSMMGCGPDFSEGSLGTDIDFEPDRPEIIEDREVAPYNGADPYVIEAQQRFRNGLDIQNKIIWRTCTPNDGVCHNKKEYPDLHTPANLLAAINAPCNVQPGQETSVYDRCERPGDRFTLESGSWEGRVEVGWIQNIEGVTPDFAEGEGPDETTPGLHVILKDPLPTQENSINATARFVRTFEGNDIVFARFRTRWFVVGEKHIFGRVGQNQTDDVQQLMSVGVVQGDMNRNGIFGASNGTPIKMLDPGNPEESYLIARIRGEMLGERVPGSRMPLANQPLNISEMLGLFCWVEGIPAGEQLSLDWPIDYNGCSYAQDPENLNLLGEGVTWETRISKILEANCGGCHGGSEPDAGFDVLTEGVYDRLLEPSTQNPEMPFITPGNPENSYLWLKLINDDSIVGLPMPYNPLTGEGQLTEAELGDIQTWIVNGAVENE